MEEQLRYRYIRHTCSVQGWALLAYLGIMNGVVLLWMVFCGIGDILVGDDSFSDNIGWAYFFVIGIGAVCLFAWKKRAFCVGTIWTPGKPMKVGRFFGILSVFLSVQMVSALLSMLVQWILLNMGYQVLDVSSVSLEELGMFLYVGLGAPISEEILFRGLILRSLEPFGKKFAIFASALLFGLFHGNLTQAPFAFGVGLILGYVTLEHNIGWAMLLHMINNLILSDTLYRLVSLIPGGWGALVLWGTIAAFSVAALVVLIRRRGKILAYLRREYDDPLCRRAFFRAPGIITLLVILLLVIAATTWESIVPIR
ncbi:MAG: CPBP family intramembrane metalloprotease [Oscillospiraceae bacterium]|nr:CPBP family intramembrane metalloprotease [Oscillospiraceae bacterium]